MSQNAVSCPPEPRSYLPPVVWVRACTCYWALELARQLREAPTTQTTRKTAPAAHAATATRPSPKQRTGQQNPLNQNQKPTWPLPSALCLPWWRGSEQQVTHTLASYYSPMEPRLRRALVTLLEIPPPGGRKLLCLFGHVVRGVVWPCLFAWMDPPSQTIQGSKEEESRRHQCCFRN